VIWWHPHQRARGDAVKAAVAKFNQDNPWKIQVQEVFKGDYPVIFQAMLAALQTKEVPNLTVAYQNEAGTYQNADALVDLNDFFNDKVYGLGSDATNDFFQGYLAQDVNPQFGNKRLGFALYRSAEVLYFNRDALKTMGYDGPPKSWDEFKEMSCKYKESGADRIGYEVRTDASFVAAATFGQGGDIYDYKNNKFMYDSAEAQVAPQVMQDMLNQGCASLIAAAFADQTDFETQKSLFYVGSSSGISFIKADLEKSGKKFDWDIAALPYKDQPVINVYGASVSVPKSTKAQELAAWLFIRWYTEPEQQAQWAAATYYFPVRQSTAANMQDIFTALPQYKSAFDLMKNTKAEPPVAAYSAVRPLAQTAMNDVLDGKPVADTFAKLNDDANQKLEEIKPGAPLPTPLPTAVPTAAK
jgi:multiple sugar transport system substrate-binding protein